MRCHIYFCKIRWEIMKSVRSWMFLKYGTVWSREIKVLACSLCFSTFPLYSTMPVVFYHSVIHRLGFFYCWIIHIPNGYVQLQQAIFRWRSIKIWLGDDVITNYHKVNMVTPRWFRLKTKHLYSTDINLATWGAFQPRHVPRYVWRFLFEWNYHENSTNNYIIYSQFLWWKS